MDDAGIVNNPLKRLAYGRALEHFRLDDQDTPHGLHLAEEKLLEAVQTGRECFIDFERPEQSDPHNCIRAAFARFLALGGDHNAAVHEKGIQVRGAMIVEGNLDLEGCDVERPLTFISCNFENKIIIRLAKVASINLAGCKTNGIYGQNSFVEGNISLQNKFVNSGVVTFASSIIKGNILCNDGLFQSRDGQSLIGSGAHISGSVLLQSGFRAEGEVQFIGADIGGSFSCAGGEFGNLGVKRVDSTAECPTNSMATLILDGSNIGGYLFLRSAANPGASPTIFQGSIDLRNLRASALIDHKYFWPERVVMGPENKIIKNNILLDGLVYQRFAGRSSIVVADRLDWLKRQPSDDIGLRFKPQPYEQLAKVYREMGHKDDARTVLLEKEKRQLRRPISFRGEKLRPWWTSPRNLLAWLFLEKLVGYGYRSHRAILLALAVWAGLGVVYMIGGEIGAMAPSNPNVYLNSELTAACAVNWTACTHPKMLAEHPPFYPWLYSLDLILPIVPLGQEAAWSPVDAPEWRVTVLGIAVPLLFVAMWFEIIFGWVIGLVLVAVVSGVVRRDVS